MWGIEMEMYMFIESIKNQKCSDHINLENDCLYITGQIVHHNEP